MKSYFIETPPALTPFLPRANWATSRFGIEGNSIVSFVGPDTCFDTGEGERTTDAPLPIKRILLHLIVEHTDTSYAEMLLWQRLLNHIAYEELGLVKTPNKWSATHSFWSQISCIFYLGIGLTPEFEQSLTPDQLSTLIQHVATDYKPLAIELSQSYTEEWKSVKAALFQQGFPLG